VLQGDGRLLRCLHDAMVSIGHSAASSPAEQGQ
jgi:hypothetical protein